jgi:hypothetical protein
LDLAPPRAGLFFFVGQRGVRAGGIAGPENN